MKPSLQAGLSMTRRITIDRERTIGFMGEDARVYATPSMIMDIERTCRDLILEHFRMVAEREQSTFALHKLRKFTGWYTHGLPNGRKLRQAINQLPDVPTFMATVEEFLGELLIEEAA